MMVRSSKAPVMDYARIEPAFARPYQRAVLSLLILFVAVRTLDLAAASQRLAGHALFYMENHNWLGLIGAASQFAALPAAAAMLVLAILCFRARDAARRWLIAAAIFYCVLSVLVFSTWQVPALWRSIRYSGMWSFEASHQFRYALRTVADETLVPAFVAWALSRPWCR